MAQQFSNLPDNSTSIIGTISFASASGKLPKPLSEAVSGLYRLTPQRLWVRYNVNFITSVADTTSINLNVDSDGELTAVINDTEVVAGVYGSSTLVPVIQVDSDGRINQIVEEPIGATQFITSVSDTSTIDLSVVSEVLSAVLTDTAVTPNTYGDATHVTVITIDPQGRITSASSVAITFPTGFITAVSDTASIDLTVTGTTLSADIKVTTVVAGSYGSASQVGTFTVGADGRLTAAANTSIQIAESQVTNLTTDLASKLTATLTSAHIFVGNGSNVATDVALSGDATLSNAGALTLNTVNSNVGSFGTTAKTVTVTVNAKGLITAISESNIAITASQVTDFNTAVATTALLKANNLSDLTNAGTARTNLGLGTMAVEGYQETVDADLSATATLTWTAGAAPSGTLNARYSWSYITNRIIWFEFRIEYAVAGTTVTVLTVSLPSDMPTPATFTGAASGEVTRSISALMGTSITGSGAATRGFMDTTGGGAAQFKGVTGSASIIFALLNGFYVV